MWGLIFKNTFGEDQTLEHPVIRVAVFDDHALMRDMIAATLAANSDFEVVGTGQSAEDAIRIVERHLPDIVLMDVNMPGNGIAAATAINKVFPAVKIIILTSDDSEHTINTALRAGAMGYAIKGGAVRDLIAMMKAVAEGQAALTPAFAEQLLSPRSLGAPWMDDGATQAMELTDMEEQILRRYAQGLTPVEIGAGIGVAPQTVGKFLGNMLVKLHASERYQSLRPQS